MMQEGFISASANIKELDAEAEGLPILRENQNTQLDRIMSNSFGFGGTNATFIFQKYT